MKNKFGIKSKMLEAMELGDETADTPAWFIVDTDGCIASGPYNSRSEANNDTGRLQWYNTSKYDIAYGIQNDDDMFVDAETGVVGERTTMQESNELAEAGDTIRTNKNSMDGKVEKTDGDTVFFRIADGRLMKTPQSNVTVVQKLADSAGEDKPGTAGMNRPWGNRDPKNTDKSFAEMAQLHRDYAEQMRAVGQNALAGRAEAMAKELDTMNESAGKSQHDTNKEWRNSARDATKKGNKWSPTNLPKYTDGKKKEANKKKDGAVAEGGMGGINRCAPAQDVSYEKVLDEVMSKYRVDELSVDKMKAYKDAARSDKSMNTRPLRKIANTVTGVKKASDKIRTKTGDRRGQGGNIVMANLEERLKHFVDEAMAPGTSPWGGNPKKLARSPKSSMQGTQKISFSDLVQDTIKKHGLKWAFEFYVKKHGLPPREFRIFAGI